MSVFSFSMIEMSKGKDSFRANTKDAFAFLFIFNSIRSRPPKKGTERLRVKTLKDALAFTRMIIHPAVLTCQAATCEESDRKPALSWFNKPKKDGLLDSLQVGSYNTCK